MIVCYIAKILWLIGLIFIVACSVTDLKDRIIPNKFVVVIALAGFAHALITTSETVWLSTLVALLLIFSLGILSHWQIIGGGDVKMISAVSLLVPPNRIAELLAEIAIAGGLLSCFYLFLYYALRTRLFPAACRQTDLPEEGYGLRFINVEGKRIVAGCTLPYALAVMGGVCIFIARG